MKISSFTFIVTDNCNFSCSYCYKKKKEGNLDYFLTKEALSFFIPFFTKKYFLGFYGGEPLICFDLIKSIVHFTKNKNEKLNKRAKYSITTNGSLITDDILEFLNKHKFHVELSFDGLAQDIQRKKGSFETIVSNTKKILKYPNINLEINSVFTSNTIGLLSKSIKFIIELNVPNIRYSLSTIQPWDKTALNTLETELSKLSKYSIQHFKEYGILPVANFRENKNKGIFFCSAGQNRLAITPTGNIWGCHLFPDYFEGKANSEEYQKYNFGTLKSFMKEYKDIYPKISSKYKELSMDNFKTADMECFLCSKLEECSVCPVNAAFLSGSLGKIQQCICKIQEVQISEKLIFQKDTEGIKVNNAI